MNTSRSADTAVWRKVLEQFDLLAALPPDECALHLARLQQADPSCWRTVKAMLEADQQAEHGGFMHQSAMADIQSAIPADDAAEPMLAGLRLGPWCLEAPLGSGGMGQVWLARREDGLYRGQVAIKLLRDAPLDDALANERFAREGKILARLAHPNIARLLDAGLTGAGRRYLVLEYVQGKRVDDYCDAKRLGLAERLRIFRQICDAVQHAHNNLVVHRDLKPSNVLVQADGQVKLLDFGVARLLADQEGDSEQTDIAAAVMTPEYAAPEQIAGAAVTTATDVYALGVLLYRLLSSCRPYGVAARSQALLARAILEQPPRRLASAFLADFSPEEQRSIAAARDTTPERLRRLWHGDLETIVATALKKQPAERYASARALADDIDRHLAMRPIQARADHLAYRLGKFLRRHWIGAAVAAMASVALLFNIALIVRQTARADAQRVLAEQRGELALQQQRRAEQQGRRADQLAAIARQQAALAQDRAEAEAHFRHVAERELSHALREEQRAREQSMLAARQTARAEREADRAEAVKAYLIDIFRANTREQADPERARRTTVRELLSIGSQKVNERFAEQPDTRQSLLAVLGELNVELGQLETGLSLLTARIEALQQLHGDTAHADMAAAYVAQASLLREMARPQQAEQALERAGRQLAALGDAGTPIRAELLVQRALLQLNSRHRADALGSIEEAIALFARQTPAPASGIQRQAHNAMGRILAADNRWDEAIAAFQRAETLGAKEFGGQSYQAAVNRYWIARLQVAQDKVAEAKASFRNVLAIYEKSLGENHYETRQVKSRLGLLLCLRGEPDAGLAMLQSLLNQPVPADHADDLVSDFVRAKLGEIYNDRGDLAEAERMTKPVVMAADGDKPSQDRGMALLAHAHTLALRGRFNEAWQSHARAAAVFQSLGAARSGVGVYVPIMAVDIANMEGRPERAAVALASAAAVPQAAGQGPSRQLSLLQLEGDLRMVEGKPAAALLLYRQLIALLAQTPNGSSEHERLALVHLGEGRALLAMADLPAARQALEKALAHRVQTGVAHGIWPGQIRSYLALVLAQQGKHSEALAQQALARADLQSQQPLAAVFTAPLTQLEQVAAKRNGRD